MTRLTWKDLHGIFLNNNIGLQNNMFSIIPFTSNYIPLYKGSMGFFSRNISGGKITSICAFFFIHDDASFTFSKMSNCYLSK